LQFRSAFSGRPELVGINTGVIVADLFGHIGAEKARQFRAFGWRDHLAAPVRGTDGVRLVDDQQSARVKTRNRHHQSESEQQTQHAPNGSRNRYDPRLHCLLPLELRSASQPEPAFTDGQEPRDKPEPKKPRVQRVEKIREWPNG
jgi:hypothetical protein